MPTIIGKPLCECNCEECFETRHCGNKKCGRNQQQCCEKCKFILCGARGGNFGICPCHLPEQEQPAQVGSGWLGAGQEGWEKEFDEAIRPFSPECELYLVPNISKLNKMWVIERKTEDIKSFIRSLLEKQREEMQPKVKSNLTESETQLFDSGYEAGREAERMEIAEKVKEQYDMCDCGRNERTTHISSHGCPDTEANGFNRALNRLLSLLTSKDI